MDEDSCPFFGQNVVVFCVEKPRDSGGFVQENGAKYESPTVLSR